MSLDVTLKNSGGLEVYWGNITHNLTRMAEEAGLYAALWRPDEKGFETAAQLAEPLSLGLARLLSEPDKFKVLSPYNGWGNYEGLVTFVEDYLAACQSFPEARVEVCR